MGTITSIRAPLRWAGSKRALLPTLTSQLPAQFERYIEPFFGSGCLYFSVLPHRAIISDFNSELIQFYRALRGQSEQVSAAFYSWDTTESQYYSVRDLVPEQLPDVDRAARFLYLNRYSFNGVYRTNRAGKFNVPVGRNTGKPPTAEALRQVANALKNTDLSDADYLVTLAKAEPGDFVYLDPPYVNPHRKGYGEYGYGCFGTPEDLEQLRKEIDRLDALGAKVMFSFGSLNGFENSLAGWEILSVSPRQSVASVSRSRASNPTEILARNYNT